MADALHQNKHSANRKRWAILISAAWLCALLCAFLLRPIITAPVLELLLLTTALLGVLRLSSPSCWIGSPARYRLVAALLVIMVVTGHLVGYPGQTFPFVDWRMYTRPNYGPPQGILLQATHLDGRDRELLPWRLVEALPAAQLADRLRRQVEESNKAASADDRSAVREEHEKLIRALVTIHDLKYPENPIRQVAVYRTNLITRDPRNPERVVRLLWKLEFPGTQ